jgi:hypothetical protein
MKIAPVAFFLHITFNTFDNVTDKLTVVHAKEVCEFCSLPPADLE